MTHAELEAVATAYDAAPSTTPRAGAAYRRLAEYTLTRFVQASRDGWRFVAVYGDGAAPDMAEVVRTQTLPVYDESHGHPELSNRENWAFRAVHDLFGHVSAGADFSMDGEINAARAQLADFEAYTQQRLFYRGAFGRHLDAWTRDDIDATRRAIWAEIVGQAAYYAVHGRFPTQKAITSLEIPA